MRYFLKAITYLFLITLISSCYTKVVIVPTNPSSVTHILAVDSKGDTVKVSRSQFLLKYEVRPTYYEDWRFYYNDRWVPPYSYYTYQRRWSYSKVKTSTSNTSQKSVDTEPRSTGTTKSGTTGRSKSSSNVTPQRDKSNTTPKSRNN